MLRRLFLLDFKSSKGYKTYELGLNMSRAQIFTAVIFVLEIFMLLLTFVSPSIFAENDLISYRVHYIVLLILVVFIQWIVWIYKNKIKEYTKLFSTIIYLSVIFSLLWGVSITNLDIQNGGSISVYLTFLFMLSSVVIMHPLKALFYLLIGHISLLFFVFNGSAFPSTSINATIFFIFAWFAIRQQYLLISNRFQRDALIKEKNDILEIQNKELVRLTMIDHLTGMYNRYSLDEIFSKKIVEAYINKSLVTVMMIDIDAFKDVNDTYGHIFGDKCLVFIAEKLIKFAKKHDGYAFRYGGDEFCLIFDASEPSDIILKEITLETNKMLVSSEENEVSLSLTIGMRSEIPKELDNSWHLIHKADEALYDLKSRKRRRMDD